MHKKYVAITVGRKVGKLLENEKTRRKNKMTAKAFNVNTPKDLLGMDTKNYVVIIKNFRCANPPQKQKKEKIN